ncbi:hypothetical protein [Mycolicibacterium thermoresistibile]|uniref:Uncharacterized protein n=2 Tax=Mycolicibacterium thermoresistibile TaxID=1797 RepID=G7CEF4_MYCT3|nr:hypothetical protein [Mycolicibacterium thermoresistibile]EHI13638.1 hypothetical protein KEK_06842 [Mycolicibacterium thermoresistibile ATCC 19527]MCV7190845.1 hypothetical protein [Mycolicibacterium thermoresistibile]GAT17619.1 putative uncharacterized protein [Mycolicibacterium thermoresistibile]SNW18699.1 Uncharacterised protein [Mycolicibacterium thermoresistibile]
MTEHNPIPIPDAVAPGRADALRAAAALAAGNTDGFTQVLAELSCLHPAAWQTTLGAALAEWVQLLIAVHGGNQQAALEYLEHQAFAALDRAEAVAQRREGQQ